jgi:hypothetical protein
MSQTETLMLVALGFVLALGCVLLFARFIWNIGQRIAKHRAERDRPALIRNLEADRDQLRASHAVMQQKLDSKLAEAHARVAEHMAEVARHRNRVQTLIETVNMREAEVERQSDVIETQSAQARELSAELEAQAEAIASLRNSISAREDDVQLLKNELEKTMSLLDESKHHLQRLDQDRNTHEPSQFAEPELPPILQPTLATKPVRETRRFDFNGPDEAIFQQQSPTASRPPSELADLLSAARRNMMQSQPTDQQPERNINPMARVISVAQRLRVQKPEE